MVREHFPWIHLVKGRLRHPQSQGMIERSHAPFKRTLAHHLKEKKSPDWVLHMYGVQSAINNRPMRSRNNLTPYSMYFGSPNTSNYGSVLGPSYKLANTECGLRAAKMVLNRLKEFVPDTIMTREHIDDIIAGGDRIFELTAQRSEEANIRSLKKFVRGCLWIHGAVVDSDEEYVYEEEQEASAEEFSSNNDSDTDDSEEFPTTATFTAAATATDVGGATSIAPIGSGAATTNVATAPPTAPPTNVQGNAAAGTTNAPPTNVQGNAAAGTSNAPPTNVQGNAAAGTTNATNVQGTVAAPSTTAPADSAKKSAAQQTVTRTVEPVIDDEGKITD
jgi:hypothetical protein